MKRKLFIFLSLITFSFFLSGQDKPVYDTLNVNFQWIAFYYDDSVRSYTRFIDDSGIFTFFEGYIDAKKSDETNVHYKFLSDGTAKGFIEKFYFIEDVDTIYNFFSSNNYSCETEQGLVLNKLIGSYVLRESGYHVNQFKSDDILIIYPLEDLNLSTSYKIVAVNFSNSSVTLRSIVLESMNLEGLLIVDRKEIILNNRQKRRLTRQMQVLQEYDNACCLSPGNPWIMQFNANSVLKTYFITNYCMRQSRNLRPIGKLCHTIVQWTR